MYFLSLGRWSASGIATLDAAQSFERTRAAMQPLGLQIRWCFWLPFGGRWDTAVFWETRTLSEVAQARYATYRAGNSHVDAFLLEPVLQEDLLPGVATYLSLGRWTSEGMRTLGAQDRFAETRRRAELLGVSIRALYWIVSGAGFDVAVLSQSSEVDALAATRLQTLHGGRIATEIYPLVPEGDLIRLKELAFGRLRAPASPSS